MLKNSKVPECVATYSGTVIYTSGAKIFIGILLILTVSLSYFLVDVIINT